MNNLQRKAMLCAISLTSFSQLALAEPNRENNNRANDTDDYKLSSAQITELASPYSTIKGLERNMNEISFISTGDNLYDNQAALDPKLKKNRVNQLKVGSFKEMSTPREKVSRDSANERTEVAERNEREAVTTSEKKSDKKPVLTAEKSDKDNKTTESNWLGEISGQASTLLSNAKRLIGLRYRYGGTSPTKGMDCSGFTQYVFHKSVGYMLPRTAAQQGRVGKRIARNELRAGDLVFFNTIRSYSHVGIYIGNGQFIHAPRTGKSISITSLGNRYWSSRFQGARRIIN